MAAKAPVGHVVCPECDHPDAEVKQDKNGDHYRYCGMCNAQYFTRGDELRERNLLAKMRPIKPDTPPASEPGEPAGEREGVRATEPAHADKAPPAAPKSRGMTTLLG